MRHGGGEQRILIGERKIETLAKENLLRDFYDKPAEGHDFSLQFMTPTAFRQNKRYVILPDIRLIVQSLMIRYSSASDTVDMTDADALEQLAAETFVTRHKLRSTTFPAEGQNIPGFTGSVTFRCRGGETMTRYLRLLLSFGEFSGVGIKTSMGMGAMRLKE